MTNDGRHRENLTRSVVDDGVDGRVLNDMEVSRKVLVFLSRGKISV